jgi:hypothetical protein
MKLWSIILLLLVTVTSCNKNSDSLIAPEETVIAERHPQEGGNMDFFGKHNGMNGKTFWELQKARAATARYRNLENAIADGYKDISVDVEEMGHHYLKIGLVDKVFDPARPEILVYNRTESGRPYLVAVEYAVPINEPRPEGFSGTADVWNPSAEFQLWLLHAWVWAYNPEGVFNPTNPLIHLH